MLAEMSNVPLLVTPLDPAGRRHRGVHDHQGIHPLGVPEGVADQDVGPESHAQTDVADEGEVIDDLVHLRKERKRGLEKKKLAL